MYQLTTRHRFAAAHYLPGHGGKCAALHGHTWEVEVTVGGKELNQLGMIMDFTELKAAVRRVIGEFDHRCLNEIRPFNSGRVLPTAENLARVIFERLRELLSGDYPQVSLLRVKVWESPEAAAAYGIDDEG